MKKYQENKPYTAIEDGKVRYDSRSHAVAGLIVAEGPEHELYFLVSKRGPGCPDNVGKIGLTCGYLGWGETRKDAMIRETYEELGFDISDCQINEWKIIDDPAKDARQNIVTRYIILADFNKITQAIKNGTINTDSLSRGGEKDEVSEILLVPYSRINRYTWAFNHDKVIQEFVNMLLEEDVN